MPRSAAAYTTASRPLIWDIAKLLLTLRPKTRRSRRLLNEECGYYPDYPDLHFLLGRSYRLQGLFPEAGQSFQKAIGCPSSSALYPVETGTASFRAYTELGEVLGKLGQWDSAKKCFEQALEIHAGYMPAVLGWSAALDILNVPAGIIAERLLQLLARLPDRAEKFAQVMYYLGRYDELTAQLNDESFPSSPEFQCTAALAHLHLKQYDQSISILQQLSHAELPGRRTDITQTLAIATWSRGSALIYEFYWELDAETRRLYQTLERQLWQPTNESQNAPLLQLTLEVINKSIQSGLLDLAARFAHSDRSLLLHAAKCLYRSGYVHPAGDLFVLLLEEEGLDGEATASLAEILYDRGHSVKRPSYSSRRFPNAGIPHGSVRH